VVEGADGVGEAGGVFLGHAVAISPDGSWLATTSDDRTARIWDATTGSVRAIMRVERPFWQCVGTHRVNRSSRGAMLGCTISIFKQ
jgi:WD40 repeat protein